jgi:HTH DNA binding domain
MRLKLTSVRTNSRLADIIDLLIAKPLVSIPLACKELRISKQALRLLIPRLGSTPCLITERSRYRCWTVL